MARLTKQQIADNAAAAEALKAEQQAELARLRKEKREKAKAEREAAKLPVVEAKPFDPQAEDAARRAKIDSAWADLMEGFEVPSWKRSLTAAVLAIAAAGGTGYLIGVVAGMLIVGAVALTGMAWLGWLIIALAIVLSAWASSRIAGAVFGYVADKRVDAHFDGVKSTVTGWFKAKPVAMFSGAHVA